MTASLRREPSGNEIRAPKIAVAAMFVLALAIASCGTVPPVDTGTVPDKPVVTAESLSAQGRHVAAAELYQRMAQQSDSVLRQRYLILTARERLLAGTPDVARTILNGLSQPIDDSNRLLWAQVSAEVAISMGNP
ncbi:MAG: hypothetical protein ACN4GT_02155, partial [Gammaproteobacteria bacterium]